MSAFASGFKLGGDMYDSAERNRLMQERLEMEKAAEARAAEEFGLRMGAARRVDDATTALLNAQQFGVQDQAAVQENRGTNMSALRRAEAGMDDSYMGAAAPASPGATGLRPEYRPATDLDMNRMQANLAAAKGDIQGLETLRTSRKGIEYDEGYKKHLADWNAMDDGAKGELISKLSYDTGVKGFGTWTPGKGKTAGYMTYLPPTGDPVKLSAKEAGDLYALTNLMSVDPTRARAEMDKVSDKVRAVAAQAFEAQTKGVTANNTATHYANVDAAEAAKGQYYRDRGAMDRMGGAQYFTGADGNTYASIPTMGKNGLQFETVRVNPQGIKLAKMGGSGADAKPVDVKEEGTKVTIGGKLMFADGMGGYIPAGPTGQPAGYLPSQRVGVLKQNGISDNLQGRLQWSADGTGIRLGNREYDPRSSDDMKALVKDAEDYDIMSKRIDESMRQRMNPPREGGLAFGPKITYRPDPRMPPMYTATDDEWAAYRAQQNSR